MTRFSRATRRHGTVDPRFGRWTRYWRLRRKMTQSELSQQTGLPVLRIHRLEVGAVKVLASEMLAIAAALGVPVQRFFAAQSEARE